MANATSSNNSTMANDGSSSSNNDAFKLGWDPKFECILINGIQAARFVDYCPPCPTADGESSCPTVDGESSCPADVPHQEQTQQCSASRRRSRRDLSMAAQDVVISLTFRLLKCQDEDEGYILEMREEEKRHNYYYVLHLVEGKETLKVKEFRLTERTVKEVTENVESPPNNKYKLSLQQRIQGKWHAEARKRKNDSAKIDKFYYHEKVKNAIRSFPDVAAFILYGVIPEISRKAKRKLDQVTASSDEMMSKKEDQ